IKMISGNMIPPPMPGHRKPTSREQQEAMHADFPSTAKGISEQAIMERYIKISGNMTLPPIPGFRKLISEERQYILRLFSISSNGYIGTGVDFNVNLYKDFWEYDPSANTWTQKADFGGSGRSGAVGFSIGSKGYIGT